MVDAKQHASLSREVPRKNLPRRLLVRCCAIAVAAGAAFAVFHAQKGQAHLASFDRCADWVLER